MRFAIVSLVLYAVVQAAPIATSQDQVGSVIEKVEPTSTPSVRRDEDLVDSLGEKLEPVSQSGNTVPAVRREDNPINIVMEKIESSLGSENTAPPALRTQMEEYEQHDPLLDEIIATVESILSSDEPADVKLQMILDTILHHGELKRGLEERADTPDTSEVTDTPSPYENEVEQEELETSAGTPTHTVGQRDTQDTSAATDALSPYENEAEQDELETSAETPTHTIGQRDTPDTSEVTDALSPYENEAEQDELETSADTPTHTIGQRSTSDPLAQVLEEIKKILGKDESSQKKIKDILAEISKPEEKRSEDPVEAMTMMLDEDTTPETAELP